MELLTVQETAGILKVSPVTVRRYIKSRRLPAVRVGRSVRIRAEDVESLLVPIDPDLERLNNAPLFTMDSPLWNLVGMFSSADAPEDIPDDISRDKYEYLAEAYEKLHMGE
jgi:excisionase family DNA binding protein